MDTNDINYFDRELTQLRGQLLSRAEGRRDPAQRVEVGDDGVPDFADYAAYEAEVALSDRIAVSEKKLLEKVELGLERLANGNYEECVDCGESIPLERLRAKPTVSLCVACQARKERGARRT